MGFPYVALLAQSADGLLVNELRFAVLSCTGVSLG